MQAFVFALYIMKKLHSTLTRLGIAALFVASTWQPTSLLAQSTCAQEVVVQAGDWLSQIAQKQLGNSGAYSAIVEATNAKANSDKTFSRIDDPNLIYPGQKLCIPSGVGAAAGSVAANPDDIVEFTLLHMNDVYEITPVSGAGGLARVATLRKLLKSQNPNTFTLLSGDLYNPSALGTARVDGERLNGRQMIATMNVLGLDLMTFGNHEFDVDEPSFRKRMTESKFAYVSSNVFDANDKLYAAPQHIVTATNKAGKTAKIGFIGAAITSNPKSYVKFTEPISSLLKEATAIRPNVDFLVGVTHLSIEDDTKLARQAPMIDIILGGHEHTNFRVPTGPNTPTIFKADANARTVYIHNVRYNTATKKAQVSSRLQEVTDQIADDPETGKEVTKWVTAAFDGFRKDGFNPEERVVTSKIPLDGTEESVRTRSTDLTKLIAEGVLASAPGTEVSIFNGGSIRIDDTISPGPISQYDVIRILPFGGKILSVEMKGSLLAKVLTQGEANKGKGGYLQTAKAQRSGNNWLINGGAIDPNRSYKVAINDFLMTGRETGLEYLKLDHPDVKKLGEHEDIRFSLIKQLKKVFG